MCGINIIHNTCGTSLYHTCVIHPPCVWCWHNTSYIWHQHMIGVSSSRYHMCNSSTVCFTLTQHIICVASTHDLCVIITLSLCNSSTMHVTSTQYFYTCVASLYCHTCSVVHPPYVWHYNDISYVWPQRMIFVASSRCHMCNSSLSRCHMCNSSTICVTLTHVMRLHHVVTCVIHHYHVVTCVIHPPYAWH